MIFGFNTDVKSGETVYHVQSEARERECLLQTQVFVSGHCVAKRATSYTEAQCRPDFSPEQMHDLLRAQHKEVLELVRAGDIARIVVPALPPRAVAACSETHDDAADEVEPAPLALTWVNAGEFTSHIEAPLQFFVSRAGRGIGDARITVRVNGSAGPPQYAQGVTAADGWASVPISFDETVHGDLVAVLVQANAKGRSITRKFSLRRNP
jgi:hypothetical protein